jgi:hypothetical protein
VGSDERRYDSIRATVVEQRDRAVALMDRVTARYLKERLSRAIADLEDIESLVLPHARNASTSSDERLGFQLAALHLQIARATINGVQDTVDKFGYNVEVSFQRTPS